MRGSEKSQLAAVIALAVLTSVSACGGGPGDQASGSPPARPFVVMLRSLAPDFEPSDSPEALAKSADITVEGRIVGVSEGRAFAYDEKSGPISFNVMLEVEVDEILAGDETLVQNGRVWVELFRAESETAAMYRRAIPEDQRVVLFLSDWTDVNQGGPVTPPESVPAGASIFAPYADGFLLVEKDRLIGGFVDLAELGDEWSVLQTVAELARSIAQADGPPSTV